ncbi:MAG: class I SAM-dependent methyltransferase [Candidatus Omnitrophica bacterium]|nr:class I SAM-dependent methyltransferase [Candidatus Omnitrophota bacterium]
MTIFGKYAEFYDSLYQDKNYIFECRVIESIFRKFSGSRPKTILDLGCGTCAHDTILSRNGYSIIGVDFSAQMLKIAQEKISQNKLKIKLRKANIQTVRLNRKFDAVISLFDVMSYQTKDRSFKKVLLTARNHLKKGGLFVFDFWFAPAVLKNRPKNKTKVVFAGRGRKVIRKTKVKLNRQKRTVDILFDTKSYLGKKLLAANKELHKLRFFFIEEVKNLLTKSGLSFEKACSFSGLGKKITVNDWHILVVSRRI